MAKRKGSFYKDHDEQSDEDYKVSENELFDCSEDESFSLVCDTSGESLGDFEDDDELEGLKNKKQKKVVRKNDVIPKASGRQKNVVNRRKRKRVTSKADDDSSDDEDFIPFEINNVVKPEIRKRVVYRGGDDDDDDGDDDDDDNSDDDDYADDKDFTLDEIDCADDEDEDELPTTRGRKILGKPQLPKGNNNRVQRRRILKVPNKARKKTSKTSKKSTRKRPRKNIAQKVQKKYAQERSKRRLIVDSDSDFVSCESSDPEFTISEEERDQDSTANKICRDLMYKTRNPTSKNPPRGKNRQPQKKRSLRKGKEKVVIEEIKRSEEVKQVCGICLSEEGKKTIRGTLNCCSHFFCFVCIMEWSKVESRCPLCKQRFVAITKAATKSSAGFNSRTAVIQVPERDQVYVPSEEELRDYLDLYENILCTECQQGGDDAHMLLCDICDSPAHTYCVGLGYEVPEGDWYCESCRLTSPRYTNPESSNPTVNHFNIRLPSIAASSRRESLESDEMYVPETPLTQRTCNSSSSPRDAQASSSSASRFAAFTVSDRRRIHHGINRLINIRWRR
ncbi:unnamed protein product [Cuscuta campestris]|uniref:PHD-type domain-containing protein n=1 Tax=Cuscuta campestris TaxID=132261 RepID=A0A484NPD6_9ASTE|nr:unnamed protein product [Cuscuta campestris]